MSLVAFLTGYLLTRWLMSARRCDDCGLNWPARAKDPKNNRSYLYTDCPICGEETEWDGAAEESSPQALFEAFYGARGERDIDPSDAESNADALLQQLRRIRDLPEAL